MAILGRPEGRLLRQHDWSDDQPVTKSTRTHRLRILRVAGVISMRAEATRRITTLRRGDLDARYPGLLDGVLSASH